MIINGSRLLQAAPIKSMERQKRREHGVSYGLTEAGYDIRVKQEVLLHPLHRFTLASSVEEFDVPKRLMGVVHDKSSNIRRGLFVGNSILEPGWKGFLTLELLYVGWRPFRIKAGTGIAQVIWHELVERADYGAGRYQNQPDRPVEAIRAEDEEVF